MATGSTHTIVAIVHDRPGVLNRIATVIRRRGFNIASLSVGHSERPGLSRITFVVDGDELVADQVTKQLRKLVDVVRIADITGERLVGRELALVKVRAAPQNRAEIIQFVDIFRANIVDASVESLIIEVTGDEDKVTSLISLLQPFGISEVMRSGRLAMVRGMIAGGDSTNVARVMANGSGPTPLVEVDRSGG
ncbi:MAG: acetolactate synthase small subunit [Dehalococcoidia bacterium]|nr:acetolactate synthase small subunit [Dehalococcoidia bacterium]